MLKQVVLLKRRDGMSMDEFMDYYENHHAKMAETVYAFGATLLYGATSGRKKIPSREKSWSSTSMS